MQASFLHLKWTCHEQITSLFYPTVSDEEKRFYNSNFWRYADGELNSLVYDISLKVRRNICSNATSSN